MVTVTLSRMKHSENRDSVRNRPDIQFVEPEEFLRLAVSREHLIRSDDPASGVRGLHDPVTGVTLVVEEERIRLAAPASEPAVRPEEPVGAC